MRYDAVMPMPAALSEALIEPTPDALWRLRGSLLEAGLPPHADVWRVLDGFHGYLHRLAVGSASREYSNLASLLDISAISGVLLENLGEPASAATLARRLLASGLSEGLMALATRQHVKAWDGELAAVHREAAWVLYRELWDWSGHQTPALSAAERRAMLDELLAPVVGGSLGGIACAALLGRLYQVVLVGTVAEAVAAAEKAASGTAATQD